MKTLLSLITLLALISCTPTVDRESEDLPTGIILQSQGRLQSDVAVYRVKDKKTGECFLVVDGIKCVAISHIPNSKEP